MSIFEQLAINKGTVSSALGKELARRVLQENREDILNECIDLAAYEACSSEKRNIRAGAAKVVEIVAEKRPELVAPHLNKLLSALDVAEPQTRWMLIRVMGFCAPLNQSTAKKAVPFAEKFIANKEGLIIASSADLFLGDLGAVSKDNAQAVFPILEQSMENTMENEQDWLMESLYRIYPNLGREEQEITLKYAERWQYFPRKSTQQRAKKIIRLR